MKYEITKEQQKIIIEMVHQALVSGGINNIPAYKEMEPLIEKFKEETKEK